MSNIDIDSLKRGDMIMARLYGGPASCEVEFLAAGEQRVFVRLDDGHEDIIYRDWVVRKVHPKVEPREIAPATRWVTLTQVDPRRNFGYALNQGADVARSIDEALDCRDAVGAVRLVPETDADGNLVIHWRDEAEQ